MSKKVNLYNIDGEKTGDFTLPAVFEAKVNDDLLAQYVRVYLANARQGTRDTKDRSEVNGKAKKPYRQKGTGHARHGSLKAPSMKGGGIAHGPKPTNFSLKMSKTMRKKALESAMAKKSEECVVLESAVLSEAKTKSVLNFLDKVELNDTVLFVVNELNDNFVKASRNIPGINVVKSSTLNAYDVLKYSKIVLEKPVFEVIENKFGK